MSKPRLNRQEILNGLHDLIRDRKSLLSDNPDSDEVFLQDIQVLSNAISLITGSKNKNFRIVSRKDAIYASLPDKAHADTAEAYMIDVAEEECVPVGEVCVENLSENKNTLYVIRCT